jgi:hypothetical protein
MIEVIDDFLDEGYYNEIVKMFECPDNYWQFNGSIAGQGQPYDVWGWSQPIVFNDGQRTEKYTFLAPYLIQCQHRFGGGKIIRVRVTMTLKEQDRDKVHYTHVDVRGQGSLNNDITTILHIGESDGDTVLFDKCEKYSGDTSVDVPSYGVDGLTLPPNMKVLESIPHKGNRLIAFDSNRYHTGNSPRNHEKRLLINACFVDTQEYKK